MPQAGCSMQIAHSGRRTRAVHALPAPSALEAENGVQEMIGHAA